MNCKIRKANLNDIQEVASLFNDLCDYLEATNSNYPGWKKGVYPAAEDAEAGVKENCLYVACIEERIVGTIVLRHKPEEGYKLADWKNDFTYDQIIVVYTLAVHPSFMHQGIATRMLQFAEDYAKDTKCKAIRLDVTKQNEPACRLYENSGFTFIDCVDLGYADYGLPLFKLYQKIL